MSLHRLYIVYRFEPDTPLTEKQIANINNLPMVRDLYQNDDHLEIEVFTEGFQSDFTHALKQAIRKSDCPAINTILELIEYINNPDSDWQYGIGRDLCLMLTTQTISLRVKPHNCKNIGPNWPYSLTDAHLFSYSVKNFSAAFSMLKKLDIDFVFMGDSGALERHYSKER